MNYWLMKTEPSVFSYDDLEAAPKKTTHWEGVRNYQARNLMRDDFKRGDLAFIYHSGIDEPAIVGVAEVVKEGYPDASAMEKRNKYFDEDAAKKGTNPWIMVDVRAVARFKQPVTRDDLKSEKSLAKMMVLQRGARLSVQPVTPSEFKKIVEMGGIKLPA